MESKDAVTALAALAQETRLALYRLLVQAGPEGLSPGAIARAAGHPGAHAVVPPQGTEPRRPGRRPARRAQHLLHRQLRAHERAARPSSPRTAAGAARAAAAPLRPALHPPRQEESVMKRFHVHVARQRSRPEHPASTRTLFGAEPTVRRSRLRQVDARRSARQFRDLAAAARTPASTTSASRSTSAEELARARRRNSREADAGRFERAGHDLLLCEVGQALGDRSAGHRLGDVPHPRARRRLLGARGPTVAEADERRLGLLRADGKAVDIPVVAARSCCSGVAA